MPRQKLPEDLKSLIEEFRSRYGGMMSKTEIGLEMGVENRNTIGKRIAGLPHYKFENGFKKWRTCDVAHRIWEARDETP